MDGGGGGGGGGAYYEYLSNLAETYARNAWASNGSISPAEQAAINSITGINNPPEFYNNLAAYFQQESQIVSQTNINASLIHDENTRAAYVGEMQKYVNSQFGNETAKNAADQILLNSLLSFDASLAGNIEQFRTTGDLISLAAASQSIAGHSNFNIAEAETLVRNVVTNQTNTAQNISLNQPNDYANIVGDTNNAPTVAGEVFVEAGGNSLQANYLRNQLNQQFDLQQLSGPNAGNTDTRVNETNSTAPNPNVLADDNFAMTMDLSIGKKEAAEQSIGREISYSELVLYQMFSEYFTRLGKGVPSGNEMNKILTEAVKSGKYPLSKDGKTVTEADLLGIVAKNGQLIFRDVQVNLTTINETLLAAGLDPGRFQPTVGTVDVGGGGNNEVVPNNDGSINNTYTPRSTAAATSIVLGAGGVATAGTLALSPELIALKDLATNLAAKGAISGEVLAMVTAAIAEIGLPIAALAGGWVAVFDKILDIAALKTMDEARKIAVANEIATLAVEASRQFAASQAAATKLAEITILTSSSSKPTDYANPPKTSDWTIPNQPVGETDLAPTGGTI